MTYTNYPQDIELETKLGTVTLAITDANHIFIDFTRKGHLTVNGVELKGSLHVNRYDGVNFTPYRRDPARSDAYSTHNALSANKTWENGGGDASDSARRKIISILVPAVNAWAKENGDLFFEAERADLSNKLDRLESEAAELHTKLEAKLDEIHRVKANLAHLSR